MFAGLVGKALDSFFCFLSLGSLERRLAARPASAGGSVLSETDDDDDDDVVVDTSKRCRYVCTSAPI